MSTDTPAVLPAPVPESADRPRVSRGPVARAGVFVGRGVLWATVVIAVLLLLLIGIGPQLGRYRVLTVLSGSMQPTLPVGALVVVTPEPTSAVRPGQVITFHRPMPDREIVTHRVIRVTHNNEGRPVVVTKGDANAAADPWNAVLESEPAWKVTMVAPGLGRALSVVRGRHIARTGLIVVPVLLALSWLAQIWRSPADSDGVDHDLDASARPSDSPSTPAVESLPPPTAAKVRMAPGNARSPAATSSRPASKPARMATAPVRSPRSSALRGLAAGGTGRAPAAR